MVGVRILPMANLTLKIFKGITLVVSSVLLLVSLPLGAAWGQPVDWQFQSGKMAFLEKRYHQAISLLSAYLDGNGGTMPVTISTEGLALAPRRGGPSDYSKSPRPQMETRAAVMLGRALLEVGNSANSFAVLRGLEQDQSLAPVGDMILYMQAEAAFQSGQHQVALSFYEHLISQFPVSPWMPKSKFKVADCHYLSGNWQRARKEYTDLLDQYPEYPGRTGLRLAIGDCTHKLGNPQGAADQFRQLVMEDDDPLVTALAEQHLAQLARKDIVPRPLTCREQLGFGKLYRRQKRWSEAEEILGDLITQLEEEINGGCGSGNWKTAGRGGAGIPKVVQPA